MTEKGEKMKKMIMVVLAVVLTAYSVSANTWTGLGSNNSWTNKANWAENAIPAFSGVGAFTGNAASQVQPVIHSALTGLDINFQTAGWTLGSSGVGSFRHDAGRSISSAGAGVNTINANIGASGSTPAFINVAAGNTLVFNGSYSNTIPEFGTSAGTVVFANTGVGNGSKSLTNNAPIKILANGGFNTGASGAWNAGTLGGTGTIWSAAYATMTLKDAVVLAPGGDGTFGTEIGTLTWKGMSTVNRSFLVLDAGSAFNAQLGDMLGKNDKLVLDLASTGNLNIKSGTTLNLFGQGALQDGAYTIIENIDGSRANIVGTFSTVTYNGLAIDTNKISVTYNTDSVVVNVSNIPEPATVGMLGLGALITLLIRRVRS
jgi:predicted small secreted protein